MQILNNYLKSLVTNVFLHQSEKPIILEEGTSYM